MDFLIVLLLLLYVSLIIRFTSKGFTFKQSNFMVIRIVVQWYKEAVAYIEQLNDEETVVYSVSHDEEISDG